MGDLQLSSSQGRAGDAARAEHQAAYVAACRESVDASWCDWPMLSFSDDDSAVRRYTLNSSAIVLPNNKAFWGCPQV